MLAQSAALRDGGAELQRTLEEVTAATRDGCAGLSAEVRPLFYNDIL